MNFSAPFISRPIATTLLTIGLTLVGLMSLYLLPIAPLPHVDIPTIKVKASLPGASPETMATVVTTPLERALGRISGVTEMYSHSTLGKTKIVLQFDFSRDINGAARDVQAALNAAQGQLPKDMASNPSYRKVNPSDSPILILGLDSDSMTPGQLYDVASTIIAQKLSQLKGVGEVELAGSSAPAVRIDMMPQPLHKYGIGFEDVRKAIIASNTNLPRGSISGKERRMQVSLNGQAKKATEYMPVIVGYNKTGAAIKLSDIAHVSDSVQDVHNAGFANGKPSVLVIIRREPTANIIETVEKINDLLPELRSSIPAAVNVGVMMERTSTVKASLTDAGHTLIIAIFLVTLVVLVFLRDFRTALVPIVAVPVSIVTTFTIMYFLGYTLDNLSLMALTIVVGFVVDDAIVVLENVSRHIEKGLEPKKAALIGAKEVGTTILSMTLVLVAVFIPFLLMGGYVGLFVREFSVTLSVAILISLVVALTTAPMMCAYLIKPSNQRRQPIKLFQISERGFNAMSEYYRRGLDWVLKHSAMTLTVLILTVALNIYLYVIISKGYFPEQDTGQLSGQIQGDQTASFQLMQKKLREYVDIIQKDPAVKNVVGYTGGSQRNSASLYIMLKPLSERNAHAAEIVNRLKTRTDSIAGATLTLKPMQDIKTGGRRSRSFYEYTIRADDLDTLLAWEPKIRQALAKLPQLVDVDTEIRNRGLETALVIDHATAARFGVSSLEIDKMLNNAFSQRAVSIIYQPLNQYRVILGITPEYTESPDALKNLYVTGRDGKQIPLSLIAKYQQQNTLLEVSHYGLLPSISIAFNKAKGVSLSEATAAINGAMNSMAVPSSLRGSYQGSAKAFKKMLDEQPILLLTAFLTLYIVLGVLYESLIHPITILSTLPSAGVGALLALMLFGTDFNVIAMIGIFMLIGIVMKNAIMMIDFAQDAKRHLGMSSKDAIHHASLMRFRPILMTSLAALLAAVPLAIGQGDGAEMRQPLGIAIGGGLIMSQLLTLFTIPVVYLYLDRLANWANNLRKSKTQQTDMAEDSSI